MGLNVGGSDEPVGLEEGVSVGEEGGLVSSPLEGAEEGANETVGLSVGVVEGADEIVGNAVDVVGNEVGLGEGSIAGGANGQYSCLASPSSLKTVQPALWPSTRAGKKPQSFENVMRYTLIMGSSKRLTPMILSWIALGISTGLVISPGKAAIDT